MEHFLEYKVGKVKKQVVILDANNKTPYECKTKVEKPQKIKKPHPAK